MMNKTKIFFRIFIFLIVIAIISVLSFNPISFATAKAKKELPIRSVLTTEKKVAISFDTGGSASNIYPLLSLLNDYNVKSTFFICGYWFDRYKSYVQRIYDNGHDIGNHGTNHLFSSRISVQKNIDEIMTNHNKIKEALNYEMDLFRVPYDDYNNKVLEVAKSLNYYTTQWSIDSSDWQDISASKIIDNVLNSTFLRNGAIILFHDDGKNTLAGLKIIIETLLKEDYQIVPISQLIYRDNYIIDEIGRQIRNSN